MKVLDEKLVVSTDDRNEKGQQIDAEERPAVQEMAVSIPITMSNGQSVSEFTGGKVQGEFAHQPTMSIHRTALEFASEWSRRCELCRHFDNEAFLRWVREMESSLQATDRARIDLMRSFLIEQGMIFDGPGGIEEALACWGICRAITDFIPKDKRPYCTWPEFGCPPQMPGFFKAQDRKESERRRDEVLLTAQGGGPKRKALRVELAAPVQTTEPKKD